MRPVEVLQSLAFVFYLIAILLLVTRRKIVRNMERARAFDERSAVVVDTSRPWRRFIRNRLEADGVLRPVADGRHWLDQSAWQRRSAARRRRARLILACMAVAAAIAAIAAALLRR